MRADGRRLALTNGCFDLLHVGHVRYLEEARALGDALAVGLNGDASVRRLKGTGRPLNSAGDRAAILSALSSVDFVVIFDEDTAAELVSEVHPMVYVKGGDYSSDPEDPRFPPEGEIVLAYGGEVASVDFVAGHSTTAVIESLRATLCSGE
jgi:rfaE bifunctional protein nucleotidyltransferase chain/domain